MSERVPIPDRAERERALDPSASFIVQAPAGSGKTELLIQRFLALLARVSRPEEILAITFTRKAAAEVRRRIGAALAAARASERPARPHEAKTWDLAKAALARNDAGGWGLEESAARLRVQTIDALCASLTRQMPVLAKFGAQPESLEDARALYREAARESLALAFRHGGKAQPQVGAHYAAPLFGQMPENGAESAADGGDRAQGQQMQQPQQGDRQPHHAGSTDASAPAGRL